MGSGQYGLEGRVRARPRGAEAIAAGTPMDGLVFANPKINQRFSPHRDLVEVSARPCSGSRSPQIRPVCQ